MRDWSAVLCALAMEQHGWNITSAFANWDIGTLVIPNYHDHFSASVFCTLAKSQWSCCLVPAASLCQWTPLPGEGLCSLCFPILLVLQTRMYKCSKHGENQSLSKSVLSVFLAFPVPVGCAELCHAQGICPWPVAFHTPAHNFRLLWGCCISVAGYTSSGKQLSIQEKPNWLYKSRAMNYRMECGFCFVFPVASFNLVAFPRVCQCSLPLFPWMWDADGAILPVSHGQWKLMVFEVLRAIEKKSHLQRFWDIL